MILTLKCPYLTGTTVYLLYHSPKYQTFSRPFQKIPLSSKNIKIAQNSEKCHITQTMLQMNKSTDKLSVHYRFCICGYGDVSLKLI